MTEACHTEQNHFYSITDSICKKSERIRSQQPNEDEWKRKRKKNDVGGGGESGGWVAEEILEVAEEKSQTKLRNK